MSEKSAVDSRQSTVKAILALVLCLTGGCSEGTPSSVPFEHRPVLSLEQTGARAVEIKMAGPTGLRGLQARLSWDPASVRVLKLEPGREARRIDRVFFQDPARAAGSLVFGLTDTRQVLLPARGALLLVSLEPLAAAGTLRITDPVGAGDGGEAVPLEAASLDLKVR